MLTKLFSNKKNKDFVEKKGNFNKVAHKLEEAISKLSKSLNNSARLYKTFSHILLSKVLFLFKFLFYYNL